MSEKLRWIHDCYGTQTVAGLVFRKTDAQSRSLGHWFTACPHCGKPNPYHEKPTPPASQESAGEADGLICFLTVDFKGRFEFKMKNPPAPGVHPLYSAAHIATLTSELAEARAEVERLRDECERMREENKRLTALAYPVIRDPVARMSDYGSDGAALSASGREE